MILCEPIERAVQIHPLFVHDDGDDYATIMSRPLLDVLARNVRRIRGPSTLRNTHVRENERFCGETELQRWMRHGVIWDVLQRPRKTGTSQLWAV